MVVRDSSEMLTSGLSHLTAPALLMVVVGAMCEKSAMAVKPKSPNKARLCSSTKTFD